MRIILFFTLLFISQFKLAAQIDTCDCHKNKPFIFPAILIGYGALSSGKTGFPSSEYVKNQRNEYFPNFHTKVDDYLAFAPSVLPFALTAAGVKSRHNTKDKIALYAISMSMNMAIVNGLKYTTQVLRPDNSTKNSFPSGHTAFAFGGAQFLHNEYGYQSTWYSVAGYSMATATGVMRILNNRHWFSDVVVGAGVGMLCTEITYRVYPKIKAKFVKPKTKKKAF